MGDQNTSKQRIANGGGQIGDTRSSGLGAVFVSELFEERPWWPIQSPEKGRKKKAKGQEEREIR